MSDAGETTVEPEEEPAAAIVARPAMLAAADDTRAMIGIRRAKGWGGLAGFAVTALAAHMSGELLSSVLARALLGGITGYMVAWVAAVTVWRRIIKAELQRGFELMVQARAAASQGETQ